MACTFSCGKGAASLGAAEAVAWALGAGVSAAATASTFG